MNIQENNTTIDTSLQLSADNAAARSVYEPDDSADDNRRGDSLVWGAFSFRGSFLLLILLALVVGAAIVMIVAIIVGWCEPAECNRLLSTLVTLRRL